MSKNIVIVGSLNMDLVLSIDKMPKVGETIHGEHMHYMIGGKGSNQTVGCARLQNDVTILGTLGKDTFGEKIINQLEKEKVTHRYLEMIPESFTGIATILKTNEDNSIIVIPGANGHCTSLYLDRYEEIIAKADLLLTQLEIPIETVEHALRLAKKHNVTTILNPAPAKPLSKELLSLVDYLTPNETEFDFITGSTHCDEDQFTKAMLAFREEHQCEIIVTQGSKGCSFIQDGKVCSLPAKKVDVVDTTGAGDTFNAALAHGISHGWDLAKSVEFSIKASSLSVTRLGAQTGMPTLDELEN